MRENWHTLDISSITYLPRLVNVVCEWPLRCLCISKISRSCKPNSAIFYQHIALNWTFCQILWINHNLLLFQSFIFFTKKKLKTNSCYSKQCVSLAFYLKVVSVQFFKSLVFTMLPTIANSVIKGTDFRWFLRLRALYLDSILLIVVDHFSSLISINRLIWNFLHQ